MESRIEIIKKWCPIIMSFDMKNIYLIELMCLYAEFTNIHPPYTMSDFNMFKGELLNTSKILNNRFRLKVKSQYYNLGKEVMEYELENGTIVTEDKFRQMDIKSLYKTSDIFDSFPSNFEEYYFRIK